MLLITTRRTAPRAGHPDEATERQVERRRRSLRIGALTRREERREMAKRFSALVPERETGLFELAARSTDNIVPFFFALTAFGTDFEALGSYIAQFLHELGDDEREILILARGFRAPSR